MLASTIFSVISIAAMAVASPSGVEKRDACSKALKVLNSDFCNKAGCLPGDPPTNCVYDSMNCNSVCYGACQVI